MVKKLQLKNGLKILLLENHKSPVVSAQVWVRNGSADETKGEEGVSHFIEHLLFKGTRQFKMGEIASLIEGSGGELNAYTSFDQTVFHITISKEYSDTALLALSEMIGFAKFDADEIDREREVVIEEIKRGQDNPGRRASQLVFSTAYRKHPYRLPIIGFEKIIRKISRKKIVDFYQKRYGPQNMFAVIVGDFEFKAMAESIKKYFGEIPPYPVKKIHRPKEVNNSAPRVAVEVTDFQESLAHLAWHIPNLTHADCPALDVLALVFGQGDSSRLVQRLRIDKPLVNSIGTSSYTPKDSGLFLISFGFNPANLNVILEALKQEIQNLYITPPTEEEIAKAVAIIESEEFFGLETVDGIARKIGSLEFMVGDQDWMKTYLKRIRAITPQDLIRVAQKYLNPKYINAAAISNTNLKPALQKWIKELRHTKTKCLAKKPKLPPPVKWKLHSGAQSAPVEKIVLKSGATVLLRHSTETPVVAVRAAFIGGLRAELENQGGLSELLSRVWMCGTANRSEEQINLEIEKMAASLGAFSGRNTMGLSLEILQPYQEKMSELFAEVLTQPIWPTNAIEREKKLQIEQIRTKSDNPSQIAVQNFMASLFSTHPYSRDILGSKESLTKIGQTEVKNYFSKLTTKKNAYFVVAGNFDRQLWLDCIENSVKHFDAGLSARQIFNFHPPEKDVCITSHSEKAQSHVVMGFPGLTFTDPDRYSLEVMQSILAGQGGRLFYELRDKASLAYSVSPIQMEGIDAGYFGAYIGCSPEKVDKALSMMKEEFEKLCNYPPSKEEVENAKRYLIGRTDIDLQRTASTAASLLFDEIYGLGYNEIFQVKEKLRAVTPESVQKVAQRILTQKSVTSIVGPQ